MKKVLLIFLVTLFFTSCKNNSETNFDSLKIKDVSEILKTVILEDSLNVLKNEKEAKMFCEDLIKLDIYIPEKRKNNNPIPPPLPSIFNVISLETLLHYKIENELFFNSNDSLYLLQQNINPPKLKIEKEVVEKINLTTIDKEKNKSKIGKPYKFYEMTIPIFSSDNEKAYLELNYYCGRLCGVGLSIFLIKINGQWKIINKRRTWIS